MSSERTHTSAVRRNKPHKWVYKRALHKCASAFFSFVLAFSLMPTQGFADALNQVSATEENAQLVSSEIQSSNEYNSNSAIDSTENNTALDSSTAVEAGVEEVAHASSEESATSTEANTSALPASESNTATPIQDESMVEGLGAGASTQSASEGATVESELVTAEELAQDTTEASVRPLALGSGEGLPAWLARIAQSDEAVELPASVEDILSYYENNNTESIIIKLSHAHLVEGASRIPQTSELALLHLSAESISEAKEETENDESETDGLPIILTKEYTTERLDEQPYPSIAEVAQGANRAAVVEALFTPETLSEEDAALYKNLSVRDAVAVRQTSLGEEEAQALEKQTERAATKAQATANAAFEAAAGAVEIEPMSVASWLAIQHVATQVAVPYVVLNLWDESAMARWLAAKDTADAADASTANTEPCMLRVALPVTSVALLTYIYVEDFAGKAARVEKERDYFTPATGEPSSGEEQDTESEEPEGAVDPEGTEESEGTGEAEATEPTEGETNETDGEVQDKETTPSEEESEDTNSSTAEIQASAEETSETEADSNAGLSTAKDSSELAQPSASLVSRVRSKLNSQLKTLSAQRLSTDAANLPYQADGSQVETFTLSWITPDTINNGNDALLYVKPANTSDANLYLVAQLDYALSGEHDYQPGDVRIIVPTTIIKDRDGNPADEMVLPYPQAPANSKDFNWQLGTDNAGNPVYIFTNTRTLSAATKGFIQFGFSKIVPHMVADMAVSAPFEAAIEVTTHAGNLMGRTAGPLTAQIDTSQVATQATKSASGGTRLNPESDVITKEKLLQKLGVQALPAGMPDAENYVLVRWVTRLFHEGNQEFTLAVTDTIPNAYNGFLVSAEMGQTKKKFTTGKQISFTESEMFAGWQENGSTYMLVETAYPLTEANFPYGQSHWLSNNVSYTLTERDTGTTSSQSASARTEFYWTKPSTKEPEGHFNLFKWGNDGTEGGSVSDYGAYSSHWPSYGTRENSEPFNPTGWYNGYPEKTYGIYHNALNKLSGINPNTSPQDASITYTIEHDAFTLPWTYITGENPYEKSDARTNPAYFTMSNFGKKNVTSVITDTGITLDGQKLKPLDEYTFNSLYIPRPLVGYAVAKNLTPDGFIANTAFDGTFEYKAAADYSRISNQENDGTPVALEPEAAEPVWVDVEVRNADGTTSWINNYAKLDYSGYVKKSNRYKNTAAYEENEKAYVTYYYDTQGSEIANPETEAEKTSFIDKLPENMVNFRTHVTTNKAYYHYYVLPTVTLKATDAEGNATRAQDIATAAFGSGTTRNTNPRIDAANDVTMQAYRGEHYPGDGTETAAGERIFTKDYQGIDKLSGYLLDTKAIPAKTGTQIETPEGGRTDAYYVHYTAQMQFQTYIRDLDTWHAEAEAGMIPRVDGGTWYDLLPAGVTPDISSVKLREGDSITSVYTRENYNGSGRTLLVVKAANTPQPQVYTGGDGTEYYEDVPTIEFDATYDVTAFKDHGKQIHNIIAFEASVPNTGENPYIGTEAGYEGEADDPAKETAKNFMTKDPTTTGEDALGSIERRVMKDLNLAHDDPVFLYAGAETTIDGVVATLAGLSKSVSTNGDGYWSTGKDPGDVRMVYEDGDYSYRLRIESSKDTSTKGIVIYDTLESFIPGQFGTDPANPDENIHTPQWHGQLTGVNVDQVKAAGDPDEVDAKVYYSVLKAGETSGVDDSVTTPANDDSFLAQMTATGSDIANGYTLTKGSQVGVHTAPGPAPTLGKYSKNDNNATQPEYALWTSNVYEKISDSEVLIDQEAYDKLSDAEKSDYKLKYECNVGPGKIWMTEEQLTAAGKTLADVTMIAIDARKTVTGSDFVLEPGKSLAAYVYMHAPKETEDTGDYDARYYIEHNAHAFNNVYLLSTTETQSETGSGTSTTSVRFDYTKVGLKEKQVPVHKVWNDGNNRDGFRPDYVRMYLNQTNLATNSTDEKMRAIDVLEDGYYKLEKDASGQWRRTGEKITTYRDDETGKMVPITSNPSWKNGWTGIFTNIPATTGSGVEYVYSITEEPVLINDPDDPLGQYSLSIVPDGEAGYVATNTHKPLTVKLQGEKTWVGDNNDELEAAFGASSGKTTATVRPESISVWLTKNGQRLLGHTIRPATDGSWSWEFDRYSGQPLYKYENGQLVNWSVQEVIDDPCYVAYYYNDEDDIAWATGLSAQEGARLVVDEQVPRVLNGTKIINFYNIYGDVVLSKEVSGASPAASDAEFTFDVAFEQDIVTETTDGEGNVTGNETFTVPEEGTFVYRVFEKGADAADTTVAIREGTVHTGDTITLKADQFVRIYDIPHNTRYIFTEQSRAGFSTPQATKTGTVVANTKVQPFADATNSVAFTNTYRADGKTSFDVSKKLVGAPAMRNYQFTFDLDQLAYDANGVLDPSVSRTVRSASTTVTNATPDADLATYGAATFQNITYTHDASATPTLGVTADAAPNSAGEGTTWCYADSAQEGTWHYAYEISERIPGAATATIEGVDYTYADAQAAYAQGAITLAQLAGASWKLAGYTYDASRVRAFVTVADQGNDQLSVQTSYQRYDADASEWVDASGTAAVGRVFENAYDANASWQPKAYKRLDGRALENEEFTFELLSADGTVLDSKKNTADGKVVFNEIGYMLDQVMRDAAASPAKCEYAETTNQGTNTTIRTWTYYYTVRERIPSAGSGQAGQEGYVAPDQDYDPTVVYDTSEFGYKVVLRDNGSGSLVVEQSYVDPETHDAITTLPVFENGLAPGGLSVTKLVTDSANADLSTEFNFRVRLLGDADKISGITGLRLNLSGGTNAQSSEQEDTQGSQGDSSGSGTQSSDSGTTSQNGTLVDTYYFANNGTSSDNSIASGGAVAIDLYSDGRLVVRPVTTQTTPISLGNFNLPTRLQGIQAANSSFDTIASQGLKVEFADGLKAQAGNKMLEIGKSGSYDSSYANLYKLAGFVQSADMSRLDTSSVTSMDGMFARCNAIISIDLSGCSTSSVENMRQMFYLCNALPSLDLSGFDTSKVTNMSEMFDNNLVLKTLNISSFDTSNVTNMSEMFDLCHVLSEVVLGGKFSFKGNNITNSSKWAIFGTQNNKKGTWVRDGDYTASYTPEQLQEMAQGQLEGTWTWDDKAPFVLHDGLKTNDAGNGYPVYSAANDKNIDLFTGNDFQVPSVPASWSVFHPNEIFQGWAFSNTAGQDLNDAIKEATGNDCTKVFLRASDGDSGAYWYVADAGTPAAGGVVNPSVTHQLYALWKSNLLDVSGGEFEFSIKAGQTATFENLPAGIAYQVWEETASGWELVGQSNTTGTIEPLQTSNATFTNKYVPGKGFAQFSGTKTFDGQAPDAGAFSFRLTPVSSTAKDSQGVALDASTMPMPGEGADPADENLTGTGASRAYTIANDASGFVQFPQIAFEEDGIYKYQISEVVPTPASAGIEYDTRVWTATVSVVDNGDGTMSSATVFTQSESIVPRASFKFENKSVPASLTLKKLAAPGSLTDANKNADFTFKLCFYNEDGTPVNNGTSFDWYYLDENGNPIGVEKEPDTRIKPPANLEWNDYTGNGSSVSWAVDSETGILWFKPTVGTTGTLNINETTLPWHNNTSATSVRVVPDTTIALTGSRNPSSVWTGTLVSLFNGCSNLESFYGDGFDTSSITSLANLFWNCTGLKYADLSNWDVSNVTSTFKMFMGCTNLEEINFTGWTTSQLSNNGSMFGSGSDKIKKLTFTEGFKLPAAGSANLVRGSNQAGWMRVEDGATVTGAASSNFLQYTNLFTRTGADIAGTWVWIDSAGAALIRVPLFRSMADGILSAAASAIVNLAAALNTLGQAAGSALSTLAQAAEAALDTLMGVQNAYADTITGSCDSTGTLAGASTWTYDTETGTLTFGPGCLHGIEVKTILDNNATINNGLKRVQFESGCYASNTMASMFDHGGQSYDCIYTVDFSNLNTTEVTDMSKLFYNNQSVTTVSFPASYDTSHVTTMNEMFSYCAKLTSVNFPSTFKTSSVTNMSGMFKSCYALTRLDISMFDFQRVSNVNEMFSLCYRLVSIELPKGSDTQLRPLSMRGMFSYCVRLLSLDLSCLDTSALNDFNSDDSGVFVTCAQLYEVKLSSGYFDGGKVNWQRISKLYLYESSYYENPVLLDSDWTNEDAAAPIGCTPKEVFDSKQEGIWVRQPKDGYTIVLFDSNGGSELSYSNTGLPSGVERSDSNTYLDNNGSRVEYKLANQGYGFSNLAAEGESARFATITLPTPSVAPTGYVFKGWNTERDGTGTAYAKGTAYAPTAVGERETLYAQWVPESEMCTIKVERYLMNADGSWPSSASATDTYYELPPAPFEVPVDPSDTYAAAGYILPAVQTVETAPGTKTVTYRYARPPYTVVYNGNGAESGTVPSTTVEVANSLVPAANSFAKAGSMFVGWNTMANGSGVAVYPGTPTKDVSAVAGPGGTATLYAQWIENPNTPLQTTSGEVTVTLKAGRSVVFPNLPAGTTYEIVEADLPEGWTFNTATGEVVAADGTVTGTGNAGDHDTATVTNAYDATGAASVWAHKALVGATPAEGQFTFELVDPAGDTKQAVSGEVDAADTWFATDGRQLFVDTSGVWLFKTGAVRYYDASDNALEEYVEDCTVKQVYEQADGTERELTAAEEAALAPYNPYKGTAPVQFPEIDFTYARIASDVAAGKALPVLLRTDANDAETASAATLVRDGASEYVAWDSSLSAYPSGWVYFTTLGELDGHDDAITYDLARRDVAILVRDSGNGRLLTKVFYQVKVDGTTGTKTAVDNSTTEAEGIVITNEMNPGNLQLSKTIDLATPAASTASFPFTITLAESTGEPLEGSYGATLTAADGTQSTMTVVFATDAADGLSKAQVSLAGGESLLIEGLPHGAAYQIEEGATTAYTLTDQAGQEGVIEATKTASASFTNTYATFGTAQVEVEKTLVSANPIEEGQFTFYLLDDQLNVVEEATNGAPNDTTGKAAVVFAPFTLSIVDLMDESGVVQNTYTRSYYVAEKNDQQNNITYDQAMYRVDVTATDDGQGHIATTTAYYKRDANGNWVPMDTNTGEKPGFLNKFSLNMPATGMAGLTGAGLLLAVLLASLAIYLRRRRKVYEGAQLVQAPAIDTTIDAKTNQLSAKGVQW